MSQHVDNVYNFKQMKTFTGVVKDGYITVYYLNGQYHREDGPAITFDDGRKVWFLNDKHYGFDDDYTNESWIRLVKLELLK